MQMVQRLVLVIVVLTSLQVFAADPGKPEQKFVAMLIWGTDDEKPTDKEKDLKDVDPALKEKFRKIFKWKNYFEVTRANVGIKVGEPKDIKLSKKCLVKIHQTEKEGMDVELIGEGKTVYKGKSSMPLKDILILAGDDKNATAWFVVLKPE
jgi:hypothetical protein